MTEIWKNIPDELLAPKHRGIYQASTHGRIRSLPHTITTATGQLRNYRGTILATAVNPRGGHLTTGRFGFVHKLVAATFIGPRPDGLEVRHKNGDPTDNRPENLEYGTLADHHRLYFHGSFEDYTTRAQILDAGANQYTRHPHTPDDIY